MLFLHGQAYSSQIWDDRGILDDVVDAGYRAVAVDLPGRGGTPEEAADAVYLFCSPESNYISGQVIVAGGGLIV